ncbi:MAG: endonuclease/exonuclease/phosphatase family protein [Saprospiraceae bacterium]
MTKEKKTNIVESLVSYVLLGGTGLVIFSPNISYIRMVTEYSVHILLGILALSMIALVFDRKKIMFAGLACTAALCIFLKNASNTSMKLPKINTKANMKIAHVNLSNITFGLDQVKAILERENIDVLSLQELTPDWSPVLKNEFILNFPYQRSEVRIDPYGMAIISKIPFIISDTFMVDGIPNIIIKVEKNGELFQVVSSYLTPALDNKGLIAASKQLRVLGDKINNLVEPVIALGDYNMVYWANEIKDFRKGSNMKNSRRDISPSNSRVPYDHIFFSDNLECTQFKELRDSSNNYIGIVGSYQLKKEEAHQTNSQLSLQ